MGCRRPGDSSSPQPSGPPRSISPQQNRHSESDPNSSVGADSACFKSRAQQPLHLAQDSHSQYSAQLQQTQQSQQSQSHSEQCRQQRPEQTSHQQQQQQQQQRQQQESEVLPRRNSTNWYVGHVLPTLLPSQLHRRIILLCTSLPSEA